MAVGMLWMGCDGVGRGAHLPSLPPRHLRLQPFRQLALVRLLGPVAGTRRHLRVECAVIIQSESGAAQTGAVEEQLGPQRSPLVLDDTCGRRVDWKDDGEDDWRGRWGGRWGGGGFTRVECDRAGDRGGVRRDSKGVVPLILDET